MDSTENIASSLDITTCGMEGMKFDFLYGPTGFRMSYTLNPQSIGLLYDKLGNYIEWYNIYTDLMSLYDVDDIPAAVESEMAKQEESIGNGLANGHTDDVNYYFVENLAMFTEDLTEDGNSFDNEKAAKKLIDLYNEKYKDPHSIKCKTDETESLFSTPDRDEMSKLMILAYTHIIVPVIKKMKVEIPNAE